MKLWLKWMILWIYHKIVHKHKNRQRKKLPPYFPLMTNSVIQWNCCGLRPNFDELSLLIVKHNPLAVCLQETFLKDTDNITVRGSIINARKLKIEPLGVFPFLSMRIFLRV